MRPPAFPHSGTHWLRRVGRLLVIVAQLVVLFAPLGESHEGRSLAVHVEATGGQHLPGHDAERCPACVLLGVHSRAPERPQLPPIRSTERVRVPAEAQYAAYCAVAPSNSCRAPPTVV